MDEAFIRNRISELRTQKGVSEYKMSTDLGCGKSYIQSISSGRNLPSLARLLCICEYFDITPYDFFDTSMEGSQQLQEAINALKTLNDDDLALILATIRRLQKG